MSVCDIARPREEALDLLSNGMGLVVVHVRVFDGRHGVVVVILGAPDGSGANPVGRASVFADQLRAGRLARDPEPLWFEWNPILSFCRIEFELYEGRHRWPAFQPATPAVVSALIGGEPQVWAPGSYTVAQVQAELEGRVPRAERKVACDLY